MEIAQVCLEEGKTCLKVGGLILAFEGEAVVDPNLVRTWPVWNTACLHYAAGEINARFAEVSE